MKISLFPFLGILEKEYGKPIDEIFPHFDPKVHASGAIAQVHFAQYQSDKNQPPVDVVVKVRHPFSLRSVLLDLKLMEYAAKMVINNLASHF
jgi:ubiquinone biosynthesis protein